MNELRSRNVAACSPATTDDREDSFLLGLQKESDPPSQPLVLPAMTSSPLAQGKGNGGSLGSRSLEARAACTRIFPSNHLSLAEEPDRAVRLADPLPAGVVSSIFSFPLATARGCPTKFL